MQPTSTSPAVARRPDARAHGLRHDVAWNIGSLVVMAVCGLLLQVLIGLLYDPAVLGAFNLVYAFYMVASQVAAFGIHLSVLAYVARHAGEPAEAGAALSAGLLATVGPAAATSLVFVAGRGLAARLVSSPAVGEGMAWAAPGLFLFAFNKTLLAGLNALSRMRAFSTLQALRPILMIAAFGACGALALPSARLPVVFTAAEVGLAAAALWCIRPHLARHPGSLRAWVRRHLAFGERSFLGWILVDLNTRINVLFLGMFRSDSVVGVYSFVAVLAEGLFQVLVAIRNAMNPRLSQVLHPPDAEGYRHLVRRVRWPTVSALTLLGAVTIAVFLLAVHVLPRARPFAPGWLPLVILAAGVVAVAEAMPFSGILLQAGHPGANTWVITGTAGANAMACVVLVPWAGMTGAGVATALSFLVQVALLRHFTRSRLGWRL